MTADERIDAFTCLACFLVHAEADNPNMTYGARKIADAINSMCDLMGVPRDVLRERLLLDTVQAGDDRHD